MEVSKQIEVLADHARFAPEGETTVEGIVSMVTQAIRFCRGQKIPRLLVDLSRLTGFRRPPLQERYWAVQEWAQEAAGVVVFALVAPEVMVDPQRFGVVVAANVGFRAFISSNEREALSWLLEQDVG
jgi:hypothetical protein